MRLTTGNVSRREETGWGGGRRHRRLPDLGTAGEARHCSVVRREVEQIPLLAVAAAITLSAPPAETWRRSPTSAVAPVDRVETDPALQSSPASNAASRASRAFQKARQESTSSTTGNFWCSI